jgi:hypothetical protein
VSVVQEGHGGQAGRLPLADPRDHADLAMFLSRLVRYEARAAVRLRADGNVLAVFGRPPFGVVALRTARLTHHVRLDRTVRAAELLARVQPQAGAGAGGTAQAVTEPDADAESGAASGTGADAGLPEPVTGPAWAGVLPPRSGWQRLADVPPGALDHAVAAGVAEFRRKTGELPERDRTRAHLDRIADEVWSRPVLAGLPLRAAHAAQALGFLGGTADAAVYRAAGWLRLDTTNGSVAVRLAEPLSLQVV